MTAEEAGEAAGFGSAVGSATAFEVLLFDVLFELHYLYFLIYIFLQVLGEFCALRVCSCPIVAEYKTDLHRGGGFLVHHKFPRLICLLTFEHSRLRVIYLHSTMLRSWI